MPVQDIHLYSHYNEEASSGGDGKSVSFLFLIAFLIVLIAWINYTNLATAQSMERAREVGVRKVLGAVRRNLLFQFLTESFLLNLAAAGIAVLLAFLLTPSFNRMVGSSSPYGFHLPASYQAGFLCLFLGGTFLSGMYAAFVLSGFRPVAVLNGRFKNSLGGTATRKALIIGQFSASIILISGTIIIYQQVHFMRNQELGADISQTLVLNGPSEKQDAAYRDAYKPFKNDILQVNGIKSITASSGVMGKEIYMTNEAYLASSGEKNHVTFYTLYVDADFLSSYGLRFVAGRNFAEQNPADCKAVVLSEEAVHLLGIRDSREALGQILLNLGDSLKIIGVVANYHQLGLNKAMLPVVFVPGDDVNNFYSLKFRTTDIPRALASVEKVWNSYFPRDPFNYFFLDESFNAQYRSGERFGNVFGLFALIAIIIACFGLLSLSAYNVLQRTREIGIRKVLGAPVNQIVFLLSKDFLVLISIAFLLAIPVAWLVMNNWLSDYAYRIRIRGWVFLTAGTTTILIALATIGFQAIKAARANPVKSLRSQ
jgi:putative ABC transport system permease protein